MQSRLSPAKTPKPFLIALAMACVYLFWGGTYLGMKIAIETMPPFLMAGARFLIAGGALYIVRRLMGDARPAPREWRDAGIVGALLLLGGNGMVAWAEQTVPSSIASLMVATAPLWMAVIGGLTKMSKPGLGGWAGLVVGFSGIAILVLGSKGSPSGELNPLGVGALLLAAVFWASGSLYSRRAHQPDSPLLWTGMQMIVGGALLLILSLSIGDLGRFDPALLSGRSFAALAYLMIGGSIIGYTAYIWLLKHADTTLASTYAFVNPVVAVLLGWLVAGEQIGTNALAAAAVIIAAVVIITLARPKPAKKRESP
jgi:drug/metabolite transporter (DMT)-like permease